MPCRVVLIRPYFYEAGYRNAHPAFSALLEVKAPFKKRYQQTNGRRFDLQDVISS
jgi:hypothetical protein